MNKGLKGFLIAILLAVLSLLGYNGVQDLGGSQEARFNRIDSLISVATTTGTGQGGALNPVLVLALDANRRYVECVNNTATDLWLFATSTTLDLTGTGAANNASTSITILNGILLEAKKAGASVAKLEFDNSNMVYGNLYVSTTAASIEIICNYK